MHDQGTRLDILCTMFCSIFFWVSFMRYSGYLGRDPYLIPEISILSVYSDALVAFKKINNNYMPDSLLFFRKDYFCAFRKSMDESHFVASM